MKFKLGHILSLLLLVFGDLLAAEFDDAKYRLGMLDLFGNGVVQDRDRGIIWLKEAANNGSYLAANELAQVYLSGKGVEIDEREAGKWLALATEIAKKNIGEADDGCD